GLAQRSRLGIGTGDSNPRRLSKLEMRKPMIEENDIEMEEPNPERLDAIQHASQIFADVSKFNLETAPRDDNDTADITNEILRRNLDLTDSVSYTVAWHAVRKQREEATRRESEFEAQQQARQREIEDYKRPSSEDRPGLLEENRLRQQAPASKQFVPAREYTDAEISAMSSDQYRRLVLGGISIADRQGHGNGKTVKEERNALILADKIINRAGVRKTKSIKLSQEELKAREERARTLAADQAERRRLEENWRKK
ncbi:MAG: hypothetical protein WA628_22610, partial [Terriglobales bacterium]